MDITEIREYNKEVQIYQKKASELLASKDYRQKELDKLCNELSELTGKQVTPDNLESVYTEMMSQFQQTLNTGREIIDRAKAEEQSLGVAGNVNTNTQAQQPNAFGNLGGGFGAMNMNAGNTMGPSTMGNNQGFAGFNQMGQGLPGVPNMGGPTGIPGFGNYDSHGTVSQI